MLTKDLTAKIREYIGTPFHHGGRVKGPDGGIDCGGMVIMAAKELGVDLADKKNYNRGDNFRDMLELLGINSLQKDAAEPLREGDLVLVRSSVMYHHLVYVSGPETIIHAWVTTGLNKVVEAPWLPEWKNNIHSVWRLKCLED